MQPHEIIDAGIGAIYASKAGRVHFKVATRIFDGDWWVTYRKTLPHKPEIDFGLTTEKLSSFAKKAHHVVEEVK